MVDTYFKTLTLPMLPKAKINNKEPISAQITAYFENLIKLNCLHNHSALLPSVLALTSFFKCKEMDIFKALCLLEPQLYHYEVHGIDAPLKVCNGKELRSLCPRKKPWELVSYRKVKNKYK